MILHDMFAKIGHHHNRASCVFISASEVCAGVKTAIAYHCFASGFFKQSTQADVFNNFRINAQRVSFSSTLGSQVFAAGEIM